MNTSSGAIGIAKVLPALFVAVVSCVAAPAGENAKALEPVSLVFHWKSQAQWAGYYMAKEKGLFAKHGLDVTLLPRQGRSDSLDLLMDGRVTFATHFLSAGVGVRGTGQPIVLIAQMFNRSNLMIVARKSAGVETIKDLSGKAVCFWDGYYRFVFRAFFESQGVKDLVQTPMGLTVSQFTSKRVVACSAMEYNEYNLIRTSPDVDPDDIAVFRLREMGMNFPEDAIYTTNDTAEKRPDICRALVAAVVEGWEYARDNPEETLAVVMREVADDPDELVTEDHQRWMLGVCVDSIFLPPEAAKRVGALTREDFSIMQDFLRKNGQLRYDFAYEDFVRFDAVE